MGEQKRKFAAKLKSLNTGNSLSKEKFESAQLILRQGLLEAQFELAEADYPVLIVIGGLEGAGKGSIVHRLNEWMDPRGIETQAFWQHSDEEESRPYFWRFWRSLPPASEIGLYLNAWYRRPGYALIESHLSKKALARRCEEINRFEAMLSDDGALIIKLWLQVGAEFQRLQLAEEAPRKQQNPRIPITLDHDKISYKKQMKAARRLLEKTDKKRCPWLIVDAEDRHYRDITAGSLILEQMQQHAQKRHKQGKLGTKTKPAPKQTLAQQTAPLAGVDLDLRLDKREYREKLKKYQATLQELAWKKQPERSGSLVAVFEGWDAAGKGSAIRRVTGAIDPRLYRVLQYAAPTDEERARHYLWRFWRRLGRDGSMTLFDRSWYGRVMVERVEGFASADEWQRAYAEINEFEYQLVEHGSKVLKFWIHISPETQLQRFEERKREPYKRHKITSEDWRNRKKWQAYEQAVNEMITRTSTEYAPWTLIAGNDKRYARIEILKRFCAALES